jgi:hypothetical protein
MRFTTAALACLLFAAPAHAADLSTMDCVGEKLDAAVRTQIEADVTRNLGESGKRPSYDPSVSKGLSTAAGACAAAHKWSPAAAKAAGTYALARIGMPIAQRVIKEHGFDPDAFEAAFQALPHKTRDKPLATADLQKLVVSLVTDEAQQTRENAELVGEYLLFLSTLQYAAHDFSEG